ncbi:MAG: DUF5916 domain-containing protein [Bacteroidia bacterium]|nr:DUF5916 domain-containing protein [Bacteroidia bacterium]
MRVRQNILVVGCVLAALGARAQADRGAAAPAQPPTARYRITPNRTETAVTVDGVLDEPVWQTAQRVTGFAMNFPVDEQPLAGQSEVMLAYDDQYLYVASINRKATDKPYVVASLRRDFQRYDQDFFAVYLCPFNDQANGFYFAVSPYGVQAEGLVANTDDISLTWDNRWFAEAVQGEGQWTAELAIPFKTLRYDATSGHWGINFGRADRQSQNEVGSWVPVPRNQNIDNLLFHGELVWPEPLPTPGRNLALIPYLGANLGNDYTDTEPWQNELNYGFDAKVAVTPGLNLDLTVNPDFSNVEADVQQINLSRFDLFFPERRQFFIENSDLFSSFGFQNIRPFFSRRVGLGVPIVAGMRLSGKIGSKWRVGLMNVQTEGLAEDGLLAQNYGVAAVQKQILGSSYIGGIFVNRQAYDANAGGFLDSNYNRVAGLDVRLQTKNGQWDGKATFQRSFSPGAGDRPIAGGATLSFTKPKGGFNVFTEYVGTDFKAETGFTPRLTQFDPTREERVVVGYWRTNGEVFYNFLPEERAVARHGPGTFWQVVTDSLGNVTDHNMNGWYEFNFRNSSYFGLWAVKTYTRLLFPFEAGVQRSADGGTETQTFFAPGGYHYQEGGFDYGSDNRKLLRWEVGASAGTFYSARTYGGRFEFRYRAQPWGSFEGSISYTSIDYPEALGETEEFVLLGARADLSFTRSLFLSTFWQYNSQSGFWGTNTRFQWRFAPMSDVFLVVIDDYDERLSIQQRAIALKVVYWLSL